MSEQRRRKSNKQRLSRSEKEANSQAWYKDKIDEYDRVALGNNTAHGFSFSNSYGGLLGADGGPKSHYDRMRINYNQFNNIINKRDFEYIIKPFGDEFGELPGNFSNKDILSSKIKALQGLEMKRPFEWRVLAVNEEATSRKEQEFFGMIKDFVTNMIMEPIKVQAEQQAMAEQQGKELNEDQLRQIQEQVAEQVKSMTPPEIKKYMVRDHQDPAEVMAHQITEYVIKEQDFYEKSNKIWKHGLISGVEVGWVGIVNKEPVLRVVNPLHFDYDKSPDTDNIQDGEWACHEMNLTPSEIVSYFSDELSDKDIDDIYESYSQPGTFSDSFTFDEEHIGNSTGSTIPVLHVEFKALKAIKIVTTRNMETGEIEELLVDESYIKNEEIGDISVKTYWIPFKYEGYKIKIAKPKYVSMREVPGQYKDLDNLYHCSLSYVGAVYDNLNSEITSLMDRGKYYQDMYNLIQWKIESLMQSDEGKKLFINLRAIPKTQGMNMKQFMYYLKASNIGYLDPTEEGKKILGDVTSAVKEIDMSLVSDIQKYIELSEFIRRSCGRAMGVPEELEGQISPDQSVSNTNNTIVQSSNVIEPYFELHNSVKKNLLKALLQTSKIAFSLYPKKKLSYILDDMSLHMLTLDEALLESSEFGLFVANSTNTAQALDMVKQLSHAAMQNQKAELSDIVKIYRSKSLQEAEELLLVAEQNRTEREQAMEQQRMEMDKQAQEAQRAFLREQHEMELEKIDKEFDRKEDLEIVKQTILSMGFNEDKDMDKDGTPDVLEVAKHGLDAEIKMSKQALDEAKFQHQIVQDAKQTEQNDEKLKIEKQKLSQKNNTK